MTIRLDNKNVHRDATERDRINQPTVEATNQQTNQPTNHSMDIIFGNTETADIGESLSMTYRGSWTGLSYDSTLLFSFNFSLPLFPSSFNLLFLDFPLSIFLG